MPKCPRCGCINLNVATNCKRCGIDLAWAREHPGKVKYLSSDEYRLLKQQERERKQKERLPKERGPSMDAEGKAEKKVVVPERGPSMDTEGKAEKKVVVSTKTKVILAALALIVTVVCGAFPLLQAAGVIVAATTTPGYDVSGEAILSLGIVFILIAWGVIYTRLLKRYTDKS